jgi:photosystem II stability/assembly factor-like uncharacterized protein
MDAPPNAGLPAQPVHVFVCYAREDKRWLDSSDRYGLIPFLADSLRRQHVSFWFDVEIQPGDEYRRLIESQIDQARISLLIVSQSFLNSDFIEAVELPRISRRAGQGQMLVIPILVEPCGWTEVPFLADRQMVPSSPLIDYTDSEAKWARVRFQILDGLKVQLNRLRETPPSSAPVPLPPLPSSVPVPQPPPPSAEPKHRSVFRLPHRIPRRAWGLAAAALAFVLIGSFVAINRTSSSAPLPLPAAAPPPSSPSSPAPLSFSGTWFTRTSGTTESLNSLFGTPDGKHLWAVGIHGVFVQSNDEGLTWTAAHIGPGSDLYGIFGTSQGQLWAIGDFGTILQSTDLGAHWTPASSGTKVLLNTGFAPSNAGRRYIVGRDGTILESSGTATTWSARTISNPGNPVSITGTSDGKRVWAVDTSGNLAESSDGTTWSVHQIANGQRLDWIFSSADGRRLIAVGDNGLILASADEGSSWEPRTSNTSAELFSVVGAPDGGRLWIVGRGGLVLQSNNAGGSWDVIRAATGSDLFSIFAATDGSRLWAVGADGTIFEFDSPPPIRAR